jgi:hypothetical protein
MTLDRDALAIDDMARVRRRPNGFRHCANSAGEREGAMPSNKVMRDWPEGLYWRKSRCPGNSLGAEFFAQ